MKTERVRESTASVGRGMPAHFSFDGWTLDTATGDLSTDGKRIRLQEQPMQLLVTLLSQPGQLVTREQLIARLWPKGVVDFDTSLNTAVRKLRLALDDDPAHPRYIETLPRKGYRFIGRIDAGPSVSPASTGVPGAPVAVPAWRRYAAASVALLMVVSGLLLVWRNDDSVQATSLQTASPLVLDLYAEVSTRQADLPVQAPYEPRRKVLDLVDRILAIDPGFAPAYVVAARTRYDLFVSNADISRDNLAALRNEIDTATRLSGDPNMGLDVMMLYVAQVELDPEAALRMAGQAPDDPNVMRASAIILNTLGRFRESDTIFARLLSLNPESPRSLRVKLTNLLPTHRSREALDLIEVLEQSALAPVDIPSLSLQYTGELQQGREFALQLEALLQGDRDGEQVYGAWNYLDWMRQDGRADEVAALLAAANADTLRLPPFMGAIPGAGRMPVGALAGWNAMLRGDTATAAASADAVMQFIGSQRALPWNEWFLKLLEAEAHVFAGDPGAARAAVREVMELTATHPNVHVRLYRDYVVARVLAWSGARDDAITLLENLWSGEPTLPPVLIARDPLFTQPLRDNARFAALLAELEREIEDNRTYFAQLQGGAPK